METNMNVKSNEKCVSQRPLRGEELCKVEIESDPKARPPNDPITSEQLDDLKPFKHLIVERKSLAKVSPELIPPFRPQWISSTAKPRRVSLPGVPKKKLWHHGAEIDPLFVWGSDDRRSYSDTRYPWRCVYRILMTGGGGGSGVIVGPRHVLTASHIVDWQNNGVGTVEVHRAGPSTLAITAITRVWYYTKVTGDTVGYSEVDEDYAVLITASQIGSDVGWLGVRTYDSAWDDEPFWRNIGYPVDVRGGMFPIHQSGKELDEDEWDFGPARSMTTSADAMPGQSGSPLFGFWSDGPYVVAVMAGAGNYVFSGDENWCAGGSYLTRLVRHALTEDT